jgi:hypothetical protein
MAHLTFFPWFPKKPGQRDMGRSYPEEWEKPLKTVGMISHSPDPGGREG